MFRTTRLPDLQHVKSTHLQMTIHVITSSINHTSLYGTDLGVEFAEEREDLQIGL